MKKKASRRKIATQSRTRTEKGKHPENFSLSTHAKEGLRILSERSGLSMSSYLETTIRERMFDLGIGASEEAKKGFGLAVAEPDQKRGTNSKR